MLADQLPGNGKNGTLAAAQVGSEKISKASLTNKADAGTVFFCMIRKALLCRYSAHVLFLQFSQGKQAISQMFDRYRCQEITLVFAGIAALEQFEVIRRATGLSKGINSRFDLTCITTSHVVARRNSVSAEQMCVFPEDVEFDFSVTKDVGVGCTSSGIFV